MITEDESHYITTHEIQLCEMSDHEGGGGGDSDTAGEEGVDGESWGIEDNDNVVYSFVDYRAPTDTERAKGKQQPARGGALAALTLTPSSSLYHSVHTQRANRK